MRNQLKVAEGAIEDLKAQLDDAMNADYMLEQLTEKNLAQGEVIKSITFYVKVKNRLKVKFMVKIFCIISFLET